MPALTIVLGFRDRDLERVVRCLDSLVRQSSSDFELTLVDYGSEQASARALRARLGEYPFCRLVYSDSRGLPWSRSRALNTGIRMSASEYVMTSDVDMIFAPSFVERALEAANPGRVLHCHCYLLPRGFDRWSTLAAGSERFRSAGESAIGGCQLLARALHEELRGFDEYYHYWGLEDHDLADRVSSVGLEAVWLNERTALYHQWHPKVDWQTAGLLPDGLWARMQSYRWRNRGRVRRNPSGWGEILSSSNRASFAFVDPDRRALRANAPEPIKVRLSSNRHAGDVAAAFWSARPGEAVAVEGWSFPRRHPVVDRGLRAMNWGLRRVLPGAELAYAANQVRSFIGELMCDRPPELADAFLDVDDGTGVALLVKSG